MYKWWVGVVLLALMMVVYVGLHGAWVGRVVFWSCPIQYRWRVKHEFVASATHDLNQWRVVLLSCDYRVTRQGAGSGEGDPIYYGEQTKWMGVSILRVYLNVPAWWEKEKGARDRTLSYFVLKQVGSEKAVDAYKENVSSIGIDEIGGRE